MKNKILIVDTEDADRAKTIELLCEMDLEIHEANNGKDALNKLVGDNYKCVVLDCCLPNLDDGLELVKNIHDQKDITLKPQLIVITSKGNELTAVQMMKAGVKDYIPKDCLNQDNLVNSVQTNIQSFDVESKAEFSKAIEVHKLQQLQVSIKQKLAEFN